MVVVLVVDVLLRSVVVDLVVVVVFLASTVSRMLRVVVLTLMCVC